MLQDLIQTSVASIVHVLKPNVNYAALPSVWLRQACSELGPQAAPVQAAHTYKTSIGYQIIAFPKVPCVMQYAQQPNYPPQQAAAPQMAPHQVPYASQPMYPQTAAAYPAYPPAAPSYYVAPVHAYPQSQMHEPPIQQPQSVAQAAMMAAIKVCELCLERCVRLCLGR